jgi:hypothetical protein
MSKSYTNLKGFKMGQKRAQGSARFPQIALKQTKKADETGYSRRL